MKVLVIGGSYFYGRVFTMLAAKEHTLALVNRGTYSMEGLGVRQICGDRKDVSFWKQWKEEIDVIVDFCAYEDGDVRTVLEQLECKPKQYILISTVDVYERGAKYPVTEDSPYEERLFPGEAGKYIAGKVALEKELKELAEKYSIACTIIRPAILYGPYNYAPRESEYIRLMVQNRVLPVLTDARGQFSFIYVKDAAQAICNCIGKVEAYNSAYNLAGDEAVDYEALADALDIAAKECGDEVSRVPISIREGTAQGVPMPFPVAEEETALYDNAKSKRELGMEYISLQEGMARTYRAFRSVWLSQ